MLTDKAKYDVKVTKDKIVIKCSLTIDREFVIPTNNFPSEIVDQQRAFIDVKENLKMGIVQDMIKDSINVMQKECDTGHTFQGVNVLAVGLVPNNMMILGANAWNIMQSMLEIQRRYAPYDYPPGVLFQ